MFEQQQHQTAILFFSRTPRAEAHAKQLTFRHGRTAARLLYEHTLRQARKTGLPLYRCRQEQQRGTDFGERLANALEDVFAAGHERVIVIGNDSPDLRARHLLTAETRLREDRIVLGPAADGGVYLIGLHRDHYERGAFRALAWETPRLQASWHDYPNQQATATDWLPTLVDLDDSNDFLRYLRSGIRNLIARGLRKYLSIRRVSPGRAPRVVVSRPLRRIPSLTRRGPPYICSDGLTITKWVNSRV